MTDQTQAPDADVDVDEIVRMIVAERQGLIPHGSVTIPMLRAALNKQRQQFIKSAAQGASAPKAQPKRKANVIVVPDAEDDFNL